MVGENGSGKTTLVKLLLGTYQPASGTITADDRPMAATSPQAWRDRRTVAFQDFSRLNLPAVQSVAGSDLPAAERRPVAETAIEAAPHDEPMAAAGRYAQLFTLQADAYR